jgi:hypothetical protein
MIIDALQARCLTPTYLSNGSKFGRNIPQVSDVALGSYGDEGHEELEIAAHTGKIIEI